jgi:hypothetical protein
MRRRKPVTPISLPRALIAPAGIRLPFTQKPVRALPKSPPLPLATPLHAPHHGASLSPIAITCPRFSPA